MSAINPFDEDSTPSATSEKDPAPYVFTNLKPISGNNPFEEDTPPSDLSNDNPAPASKAMSAINPFDEDSTPSVHVLMYNLEETALCPPIPLEEIQDMFERNGVIAGLQKWDICMVPFGVEGKMHRALILGLSENLEELQREYHTMMEKKDLRQPQQAVNRTMHVLVYNLEETALCPPIPLKEIQDMFERNGVIAGLQKWDICMVPYGVEGKMHRALIVELSDNLKELQSKYHTVMEKRALRQAQEVANRPGKFGKIIKFVVGGAVIVGLAAVAGPRAAGRLSGTGVIVNTGELSTAKLVGTAGIEIASNAMNFAAKSILTPRLG
ncbi:uncharacterized protein LOC128173811 isoform X2 [Crassostrea angulata]|uniref:uncharacterized protein LOC128173811 isoform X2 n=1 Tax=Magallana angulata TaxID=2784310 RepID=UPI0022B0AAAA|nr:uncharacterized protein LOC128173811 isoform X2 [Crassostrea angulata]